MRTPKFFRFGSLASSCSSRWHKTVVLAGGLLLTLTGGAFSAIPWTFEWDATTQTPESIGLTFSGGTNPNLPTPEGLIIPETGYYSGVIFDGEAETGWTMSFRVRRVDTSDAYGAFLAVWDNDSYFQFDFYSNVFYRTNGASGIDYVIAPENNNQEFADIQISKLGGVVNIYYGQNDTPVAMFEAFLNVDPGKILLGNYSSGTPVSEITYLKWTNTGAYLPSQMIPEPSVWALVSGAFLMGAAGWRLKKRRASSV